MPTFEEVTSPDEESSSSSDDDSEEQEQAEPQRRNRPRVPSIEEVTEQDLFGDIDPPEPEPARPSLKDQANEIVKQKDFHGAAALYTEALAALGPDDPERVMLLSNLALCMLKLNQWQECVDAASQALELDTDHTKALFRRGQARRELGELAAARSDLERSLETAPPNLAPAIRTALAEVNGKITGTAGPALPPEFVPSETFDGPREGYEFKTGPQGIGYYSTVGKAKEPDDDGLSYEEIVERRKAEWKKKTKLTDGDGNSDEHDQARSKIDLTQAGPDGESESLASDGEKTAAWKTNVSAGWSIVVSSAVPQIIAIGLWIAFVCAVAYLRREETKLGGHAPATSTGLSLSAAFGGMVDVGTLADHTMAIGLVSGAPASVPVQQQLTVVVTTRETLQLWEYTTTELGSDLELSDESTFHLQPEEEDLGLATAATVFSWPRPSSREQAEGVANWAMAAGFESGEVRLYRGGAGLLRAQQRADEYLPPTAHLQVLVAGSEKRKALHHKQQLTAVAAISVDSGGGSVLESRSSPLYHLIAVLAQDSDSCSESQQRQTCEQLLHVLSWEPATDTLSTIGTAVPPVGKSNTIALVAPFAAVRPGFLMLDVTGKMMTLTGVPRFLAETQGTERSVVATERMTADKVRADTSPEGGQNKAKVAVEEEFFDGGVPVTPTTGSVTLKVETCTNSATPIPVGDTAGLSWAADPLMPTNFYTMNSRGSRNVWLYNVRLDAIGDDHAGMCHSRMVQTASTPEAPAPALRRVCPMHGYLLGLGDSVSLWNVTGKTGSGGRDPWPVLIGGSEAKSEGLSGKYSGIGKALKQSESCRAAIVGQHEWLLLQQPTEGSTERAAGSSLVLVRSSLPFEHVDYDIKFIIYAVRWTLTLIILRVTSTNSPLLCRLRYISNCIIFMHDCHCSSTGWYWYHVCKRRLACQSRTKQLQHRVWRRQGPTGRPDQI